VRGEAPQIVPITLINVLLGWGFIGWLGALIGPPACLALMGALLQGILDQPAHRL
jgi:hypothetical protein